MVKSSGERVSSSAIFSILAVIDFALSCAEKEPIPCRILKSS